MWLKHPKYTRVAWVCGAEAVLRMSVIDAYRAALPGAEPRSDWYRDGMWDGLLTVPPGPQLRFVRDAEEVKSLALLPDLLRDEFDGTYTVFVSGEDDFRREGKQLTGPLAALRDSRHGQLIRCCRPSSNEAAADIVASWWPGAGRNIAAALLTACGENLLDAWYAADKARRAGYEPDHKYIPFVCTRGSQAYADRLLAGQRREAMNAARTVSAEEQGGVIGMLAYKMSLMPLVRESVQRRESMADLASRMRVGNPWVLTQLRSYAAQYEPDRVARCRTVLAIAETAWKAGARDGILEAVAALWLTCLCIRAMSTERDPVTDQKLPEPGKVAIHQAVIDELEAFSPAWLNPPDHATREIIEGLRQRRELGVSKYGRPLESHNGRDALRDAWEESLDACVYLTQLSAEGLQVGDLRVNIMYVLRRLAHIRLERA